MKHLTLFSLLSVLLFVTVGPLRAESSKKHGSCACAEKCEKQSKCAVHKHKDCNCS
ncbi:MAG: hypothetical protein AB7T14_08760 [Candidatus Methylacidiphilaceae bacterium]